MTLYYIDDEEFEAEGYTSEESDSKHIIKFWDTVNPKPDNPPIRTVDEADIEWFGLAPRVDTYEAPAPESSFVTVTLEDPK